MHANWVKQGVSAGGTGNLTLSAAASGFIAFSDAFAVGALFWYDITDGNDREIGIGKLSDSTTLVRVAVRETLVSGTLDRTAPTAISVTTSASVAVAATAEGILGAHPGAFFSSSGFGGMCSMGQVDESAGTQQIAANYLHMFPFWWAATIEVSQASVWCSTTAAGSVMRLGIYSVHSNGGPGLLLKEFTDAATINVATSGAKTATPTSKLWLPSGFYFMGALGNGSPYLKCPQYSPGGLGLGVDSSGVRNTSLHRALTYGALPTDETAASYSQSQYRLSVWLK